MDEEAWRVMPEISEERLGMLYDDGYRDGFAMGRSGLESIVRALAARNPQDAESYACGTCLTPFGSGNEMRPEAHAELCVWRLARQWVEEHPSG